ncbi:tail assembly chaperone [Mycobacterium phage Boilgate]|nr:tail assembly chaperone [Mycobacterium phage Boilgate]
MEITPTPSHAPAADNDDARRHGPDDRTGSQLDIVGMPSAQPAAAETQQQKSIADEWADEYEPGAELFCASFDATDFDTEYGQAYPDGTTLAVKRCIRKPPPGWVRRHAHLSDMERTFALIEMHCSDKALDILDSLGEDAWNDFVTAWAKDGGLVEGKSNRSARRSGR